MERIIAFGILTTIIFIFIVIGLLIYNYIVNKRKLECFFITREGKLINKKLEIKNNIIEFENKNYTISDKSRLINKKNKLSFIFLEGIPQAINFFDNKENFKIDSEQFKKILKAKLLSELLNDTGENLKNTALAIITLLTFIGVIISTIKILSLG